MKERTDVVSAGRLAENLSKALPQLKAQARFESSETEGIGELINELERSQALIASEREASGVMVSFRDPTSSQLQTFLAKQAHLEKKVGPAASGGLEAQFDRNDILRWFGSFFTYWKGIIPHDWVPGDPQPSPFPDVARVALLSDWGTGLYGAPVCAESIARDKTGFQIVMHLGDVYYSGDDAEVEDRFLALWPNVDGALNLALNGNHEMYTGGKAYFNQILSKFKQKASYFALQNNYWLLVGLDTAYKDDDLAGDQARWLTQLIGQAGDRKVVLFSHHQPYSILDDVGPNLVTHLLPHLVKKRIHAWYWGHEHRCVFYERHPDWELLGRCVGHSGFPEFRKSEWGKAPTRPMWRKLTGKGASPPGLLLDGENPHILGHEAEYGPHGYITLEFDKGKLTEFVHLADGTEVDL